MEVVNQSTILKHYQREDILDEILPFFRNREVIGKFRQGGFNRRPNTIQFKEDLISQIRRGVSSFHVSIEKWTNALALQHAKTEKDLEEAVNILMKLAAGRRKITLTGDNKVVDCKIDPNLANPDEFPILEDLIISAVNDAMEKTREAVAYEMQALGALYNFPNMESMFNDDQEK